MINTEVRPDGIAVLVWDMPDRSANVLNEASIAAFVEAVNAAVTDPDVKGIILASAKSDFIAGADLEMLQGFADGDVLPAEEFYAYSLEGDGLNATLRRMETSGKPVVAAITGTALGGGFELCLACHHRVVLDAPSIRLGLPEATLGLLPATGGTQRLGRMLGWRKAADLLLSGARLTAQKALSLGLVDEILDQNALLEAGVTGPAVEREAVIAAAAQWIHANPDARQPWDKRGFTLPGGGYYDPVGLGDSTALITKVFVSTQGNVPAQKAILTCLHDGLLASMDAGLRVECREFYGLLADPTAGNMIRSLFFNMQRARKLERRPKSVDVRKFEKVGVLGAGMMGAGIALVTAQSGAQVVLLDRSMDYASKGKAYSEKVLQKSVQRGKLSASAREEVLSRILPTSDYTDLEGCDLVVEAVFEDRAIKADVTQKSEAVIRPDAVFGTNTSTLPITGLAEASSRPEQFIGLHFFSPVDRMDLVEIICGTETSETTLAQALDYVAQIGKTPIIVNDHRGFYTSRVFGTYTHEGAALLLEGKPPALIENVARMTGMPVPPLALLDEISLDLVLTVRRQTQADLGSAFEKMPLDDISALFVDELGRLGRKSGKGFYEYDDGGKRLWPGLAEHFPVGPMNDDMVDEIKQRLLYIQALETARCFDEGVITDAGDADIGAILGWGFPAYTGGPLSLIDTVGVDRFVRECDALAQKYGARFQPPASLRTMAERGETFHPRGAAKSAA
ncbi:MAG: 3-hydroxyacyl-CoA dehydrogenase NAD-binding domain-containing protein [Hyphomonadaceae bacterium]|nr:3-hydroxyacyl-CoA dehydrogenase NAD-binding domain-containing protein [Hyphomonadaceae bacterium]